MTDVSHRQNAFSTSRKRPRVTKVSGRVISTSTGRTTALRIASTSPARSAGQIASPLEHDARHQASREIDRDRVDDDADADAHYSPSGAMIRSIDSAPAPPRTIDRAIAIS